MDKLLSRKEIIRAFLLKRKGLPNSFHPLLHDVLTEDKEQNHFILTTIGWDKEEFVCEIVFYIEVKENGKIWVYENKTDIPIDERLEEYDIPKSDIVYPMFSAAELEEKEELQNSLS